MSPRSRWTRRAMPPALPGNRDSILGVRPGSRRLRHRGRAASSSVRTGRAVARQTRVEYRRTNAKPSALRCSTLVRIERWFAELSHKAVRRDAFRGVRDRQRCSGALLLVWNDNPTPFTWTASGERILEKIARARRRLDQIKPGCSLPQRRSTAPEYRSASGPYASGHPWGGTNAEYTRGEGGSWNISRQRCRPAFVSTADAVAFLDSELRSAGISPS